MSYDDEVWIEDEKEVCKIERLNEDKSASKFRVDPLAKQGIQDLLLLHQNIITFLQIQNKYFELYKSQIQILLLIVSDLNEYNCLHNIRIRYLREQIYTQIGSPILISINPYIFLPNIYNQETLAYYRVKLGQYQKGLKTSTRENEFEPHLFKIAQLSFDQLFETPTKELRICSMIISGESGSGKTESTKILLKYLAAESKSGLFRTIQHGQTIEQQIFASNPVLESFGNAKTARNDNSSRFGKFMHLYFNPDTKRVSTAKIDNYLLEKSRVVKINNQERNYHIFYQIIASQIQELKLKSPKQYEYLKGGDLSQLRDEKQEFEETDKCLDNLNFSPDEKRYIYQTIAGLLHLGNVKIEYDTVKSTLKLDDSLNLASYLLGIKIQELEDLICKVVTSVGKEIVIRNNNLENAQSSRDTLAKHVYEKLFNWLIDKINQQLLNIKSLSFQNQQQPQLTKYMIGILDIFGFEIFTDVNGLHTNSFEQLNINFTNEKLQQHFNQQMFITEQKEYDQEQIKWHQIKFPDNKKIIDLIENSQLSIYKMLIDQTIVLNRGDKEFLSSLKQLPKDHLVLVGDLQTAEIEPRFDKKQHRIAKFDWFCLKHFAGAVAYNVAGFVEKNRDSINSEVFKILPNSTNPVLKEIWSNVQNNIQNMKQNNVITKFQNSLKDLLNLLNQSIPKYIRCIKPNNFKLPLTFDAQDVRRQMTCAGLMEAIQIRKAGYEIRQKHFDFIRKYQHLVNKNPKNIKNIEEMLKLLGENQQFSQFLKEQQISLGFQIGKTKLFMKQHFREFFDIKLIEFRLKYILKIQKQFRIYTSINTMKKKLKELHKKLIRIKRLIKRLLFNKSIEKRIILRRKINNIISQCIKVQSKINKQYSINQWKNRIQELRAQEQEQLLEDVEIIEKSIEFTKILRIDSNSTEEKDVKVKQPQEIQQIEIKQQQQQQIQQPQIKKEGNQQGLFLKQTIISQPNSKEIKKEEEKNLEQLKQQEFIKSKEMETYEEKLNKLMNELDDEKKTRITIQKENEQLFQSLQVQQKDEMAEEKHREQIVKLENEIFRRDQIIHDLNVKLNEYSKQIKQSSSVNRISEVQDTKISQFENQLQKKNELIKLYQDQIKSLNKGWRIKILENECLFTYFNLKTYQQKLPIYEQFQITQIVETGDLLQKQIKDLQQQILQLDLKYADIFLTIFPFFWILYLQIHKKYYLYKPFTSIQSGPCDTSNNVLQIPNSLLGPAYSSFTVAGWFKKDTLLSTSKNLLFLIGPDTNNYANFHLAATLNEQFKVQSCFTTKDCMTLETSELTISDVDDRWIYILVSINLTKKLLHYKISTHSDTLQRIYVYSSTLELKTMATFTDTTGIVIKNKVVSLYNFNGFCGKFKEFTYYGNLYTETSRQAYNFDIEYITYWMTLLPSTTSALNILSSTQDVGTLIGSVTFDAKWGWQFQKNQYAQFNNLRSSFGDKFMISVNVFISNPNSQMNFLYRADQNLNPLVQIRFISSSTTFDVQVQIGGVIGETHGQISAPMNTWIPMLFSVYNNYNFYADNINPGMALFDIITPSFQEYGKKSFKIYSDSLSDQYFIGDYPTTTVWNNDASKYFKYANIRIFKGYNYQFYSSPGTKKCVIEVGELYPVCIACNGSPDSFGMCNEAGTQGIPVSLTSADLLQCPQGQFYSTQCSVINIDNCLRGSNANTCTKCIVGSTLSSNTCSAPTIASHCITGTYECIEKYSGDYNTINISNSISLKCDSKYYLDNQQCLACESSCNSCIDGTSCVDCPANQYLLKGTQLCSSTCDTPYKDTDKMTCIDSCAVYQVVTEDLKYCSMKCPNGYKQNLQTCLTTCPLNTFNENNICKSCHSKCYECFGSSNKECSKCNFGYYLLTTICEDFCADTKKYANQLENECTDTCLAPGVQFGKQCLYTCPTNQYEDSLKKCVVQCPDGYVAVESVITVTLKYTSDSKSFNGFACKQCAAGCFTCDNVDEPGISENCINCVSGQFLVDRNCDVSCPIDFPLEDSLNQRCLTACPPQFYQYNSKCVLKCPDLSYAYDQKCQTTCPDGTYPEVANNSCLLCANECNKCDEGGPSNCIDCKGGYYLYDTICVQICPSDRKYHNTVTFICESTCPNYYLDDGTTFECYDQCPANFNVDGQKCTYYCSLGKYLDVDTCKVCDSKCARCDDGTELSI